MRRFLGLCLFLALVIPNAYAATSKPNVLVIWGDDVGVGNISAYNHGIMGYQTPNIDRIAKEGALFHRCLRAAELYRRSCCVRSRPAPVPHGSSDHRDAGRRSWHSGLGSDHRRPLEGS